MSKYLSGEYVEEWKLVLACKRFTKKVFETIRVRNQRRLTKYWVEKAKGW